MQQKKAQKLRASTCFTVKHVRCRRTARPCQRSCCLPSFHIYLSIRFEESTLDVGFHPPHCLQSAASAVSTGSLKREFVFCLAASRMSTHAISSAGLGAVARARPRWVLNVSCFTTAGRMCSILRVFIDPDTWPRPSVFTGDLFPSRPHLGAHSSRSELMRA